MHRVKLEPSEYLSTLQQLNQHENIATMNAMSHFANADNLESAQTLKQLALFETILKSASNYGKLQCISLANSAAILGWQASHHIINQPSWARPGIILYGADPLFNQTHPKVNLLSVMRLSSSIISTRQVKKGESIGYGSKFTAYRDTLVGVVACGYADGYPRSTNCSLPVAVNGHMTHLIGRVSMDMLFVDLSDLPLTEIGS